MVGNWEPGQLCLNGHFRFYVPQVIGFECFPFFWRMVRQIPCTPSVGFRGQARLTEILDQVLAFFKLLLIQLKYSANTGKRKRQTKIGGPYHGTSPLLRFQICARGKAKESRQTDTFEVCIERPLDNRRIGQGRKDASGNTLTTSQINKLRRSCIYTVSKKQNFKIRGFTIAVNARLADVGAAVCFKVYR